MAMSVLCHWRISVAAYALSHTAGVMCAGQLWAQAGGVPLGLHDIPGASLADLATACSRGGPDQGRQLCDAIETMVGASPKGANKPSQEWMEAYNLALRESLLGLRRKPDDDFTGNVIAALAFDGMHLRRARWINVPVGVLLDALMFSVQSGGRGIGTLRGCTSLALSIRDYPSARYCASLGISEGGDTTWNSLRLAWLAYRGDDSIAGDRLMAQAFSSAASPGDKAEIKDIITNFAWNHHLARIPKDPHPLVKSERQDALIASAGREQRFSAVIATIFGSEDSRRIGPSFYMKRLSYWGSGFIGCPNRLGPGGTAELLATCLTEIQGFNGSPVRDEVPGRMFQLWNNESGEQKALVVFHDSRQLQWIGLRLWSREHPDEMAEEISVIDSGGIPSARRVIEFGYRLPTTDAWSIRVIDDEESVRWSSYDGWGENNAGNDENDGVALSDLVLSQEVGSVEHSIGSRAVMLPWSYEVDRDEFVDLYFQVKGDISGPVRLSLDIGKQGSGQNTLAISETISDLRGIVDVDRSLDLRQLDKGWYTVRVEIRSGDSGVVLSRKVAVFHVK